MARTEGTSLLRLYLEWAGRWELYQKLTCERCIALHSGSNTNTTWYSRSLMTHEDITFSRYFYICCYIEVYIYVWDHHPFLTRWIEMFNHFWGVVFVLDLWCLSLFWWWWFVRSRLGKGASAEDENLQPEVEMLLHNFALWRYPKSISPVRWAVVFHTSCFLFLDFIEEK